MASDLTVILSKCKQNVAKTLISYLVNVTFFLNFGVLFGLISDSLDKVGASLTRVYNIIRCSKSETNVRFAYFLHNYAKASAHNSLNLTNRPPFTYK